MGIGLRIKSSMAQLGSRSLWDCLRVSFGTSPPQSAKSIAQGHGKGSGSVSVSVKEECLQRTSGNAISGKTCCGNEDKRSFCLAKTQLTSKEMISMYNEKELKEMDCFRRLLTAGATGNEVAVIVNGKLGLQSLNASRHPRSIHHLTGHCARSSSLDYLYNKCRYSYAAE